MQQKTFKLTCEEVESVISPDVANWFLAHPFQALGISSGVGAAIIISGVLT